MDYFRRFMTGRYGTDQFSTALLIVSMILAFAGKLADFAPLTLLSYIPLGFGVFRIFSRNIEKRRMENHRFSMLAKPVYLMLLRTRTRLSERKTRKYMKCPGCRAVLRLPRGKGRILVTCPKCKTEFYGKT